LLLKFKLRQNILEFSFNFICLYYLKLLYNIYIQNNIYIIINNKYILTKKKKKIKKKKYYYQKGEKKEIIKKKNKVTLNFF